MRLLEWLAELWITASLLCGAVIRGLFGLAILSGAAWLALRTIPNATGWDLAAWLAAIGWLAYHGLSRVFGAMGVAACISPAAGEEDDIRSSLRRDGMLGRRR